MQSSTMVPEIRRLLPVAFNPPAASAARPLHWSNWRRGHQATARRSHYRRRSADELLDGPRNLTGV